MLKKYVTECTNRLTTGRLIIGRSSIDWNAINMGKLLERDEQLAE
jgi:hypothetical protein